MASLPENKLSPINQVLAIAKAMDDPHSKLILNGQEYLPIKNVWAKINRIQRYLRICEIIVRTSILPKTGGGDAVWQIKIGLPSGQIEKFSTVGGPDGLWEIVKNKRVYGSLIFNEAIKKLTR